MGGRFRKLFTVPLPETALFFEAFVFQCLAGITVRLVPFRLIPKLYSRKSISDNNQAADSDLILRKLEKIRTATMRAGPVCPWKNKCLVQSLGARSMLNRRRIKSQLSLGVVIGEDKKLKAHAWLMAGDFELVAKKGDFSVLYYF